MLESFPSSQPFPTVSGAIETFSHSLIAKSPRTKINYLSALRRFGEYLQSIGLVPDATPTDLLSADSLEGFYTWLLEINGRNHKTTAITYVSEARAFFRFLDRRRWLHPELSYERMKDGVRELIGRVHYQTPRVDDAVALAVTYVKKCPLPSSSGRGDVERLELLRDRAILTTLYATAMRRDEVARLNRADIQDGRSTEGLITGKGGKERVIYFDDAARDAIRAYIVARADRHSPLFLRHDDGRGQPGTRGEHWRLSAQSIWVVVKKYGRLAGVDVTTHHLRHLKARVMLNNGAQLSEVQDILGHASPETTKKIYAPYTKQHLRDAFDRFSLPAEDVAGRARPASPG